MEPEPENQDYKILTFSHELEARGSAATMLLSFVLLLFGIFSKELNRVLSISPESSSSKRRAAITESSFRDYNIQVHKLNI